MDFFSFLFFALFYKQHLHGGQQQQHSCRSGFFFLYLAANLNFSLEASTKSCVISTLVWMWSMKVPCSSTSMKMSMKRSRSSFTLLSRLSSSWEAGECRD